MDSAITREEFQNAINAIRKEMNRKDEEIAKQVNYNALHIRDLNSFKKDIEETKQDIENLYEKSSKHSTEIALLVKSFESVKELPVAINNLDKTIALMQNNMERLSDSLTKFMEDKVEKDEQQSKEIKKIDDKSKIDIMDFLKKNWEKIVLLVTAGGIALDKVLN